MRRQAIGQKTPLLIAGTGAMACLFAAQLSAVAEITMLGTWKEGLAALRSKGVQLVDPEGQVRSFPVHVSEDPSQCVGARLALVLVKSWQTPRVAQQLANCLHAKGLALTLQNGLGNLEQLQTLLGPERAAQGVTTMGATLLGPGRVRLGGQGPTHLIASPRLRPFAELLRQGGFVIEMEKDLKSLVWAKLVINVAINPLTALLRVPNGELLQRPDAQKLMEMAAKEAAAVAHAAEIPLPFSNPETAAGEVARKTAANHSSMFQDIQRGAPTEIDAICGAVVKEGERVDIPTPTTKTLWLLVRALVTHAQGTSS